MTLGERIKKLRRSLDLTQREFGERISIKQNSVAQIEMGRNTSEQTISSICKEFSVNESWLRTGEGEMFVPEATDALDELVRERGLTQGDYILIEKFLALKPEERQAVLNYALKVASTFNEEKSSPAVPTFALLPSTEREPDPTPDLAKEIAELKRQNQELAAEIAAMKEEDEADLLPAKPVRSISRSR